MIGCQFCSESFDNASKLKLHEDDHKRMGDITVKALVKSVKNEYKKVIAESNKCRDCDRYKMILCEHHNGLIVMLKEALKGESP